MMGRNLPLSRSQASFLSHAGEERCEVSCNPMNDMRIWTWPSGSCLHTTVDTISETPQESTLWKKEQKRRVFWEDVLPVVGLEQLYPAVLAFLWPFSVASGLPQQAQEKCQSDWARRHPLCDLLMTVAQDRYFVSPCPRKMGVLPHSSSCFWWYNPSCSFSSSSYPFY